MRYSINRVARLFLSLSLIGAHMVLPQTGYSLTLPNFTLEEIQCKCGKVHMEQPSFDDLMLRLQVLRTSFGKPLHVNSGYRCESHNHAQGGVKNSKHTQGKAADISTVGWTSEDKSLFIQLASDFGFGGIGISKHRNFIHIDTRKVGMLWVYPITTIGD